MADFNVVDHPMKAYIDGEVARRTGGGPFGGGSGLEARVAKLESDVSHIDKAVSEIKRDLRILLGVALGAYVALAASHILLSEKMERQTARLERAIERAAEVRGAAATPAPQRR